MLAVVYKLWIHMSNSGKDSVKLIVTINATLEVEKKLIH